MMAMRMTLDLHHSKEARKRNLAALLATQGTQLARVVLGLLVMLACTRTASATCWESAGVQYGVHPWLLAAIAKVESDFNPQAVNDAHVAQTGSMDIGLMQINSGWLPLLARHGVTRERLFDACTSVTVAAWILAGLFARYGVTWEAVGAYNAGCTRLEPADCAARRAGYARKVEVALRELADTRPVALAPFGPRRIFQVLIENAGVADVHAPDSVSREGE